MKGKTKRIVFVFLLTCFVLSMTVMAVSAKPAVVLYNVQLAAANDPARPQGGITPGCEQDVMIVEYALYNEGLLSYKYAYDGSYGTATIKAYQKWQKSIGSADQYCDGYPGPKDLTKLGKKYGFFVLF